MPKGDNEMTVAPETVNMDPAALDAVTRLFHDQISQQRLHPGAVLAVYRHGRLVLSLYGGLADNQAAKPVTEETMFVFFSSTKPLASVAVLQQIERGKASLDDPVAKHWPNFGQNGKEGVTIRHLLTHMGGFPQTPPELTWDRLKDWDFVVRAMEQAPAQYPPGTVSAYHGLNHGWVCAELVRRLDGRDFPQYLRDEITGPLRMLNTYVGLPPELEERVAKIHVMEDWPEERWALVRDFNRPEVHQAVVPAAGGIGTATDMARFYAALVNGGELDGVRILRRGTIRMATEVAGEGEIDRTYEEIIRRGIGFNLGGVRGTMDRMARTSTTRTFGHPGAGSSTCWADWDLELAMAFIPNGVRGEATNVGRCADISDAVRAACR